MKLENIGFYTLCDKRALNSNTNSPLWKCELVLTDECNFRCPYCRGLRKDISGELPFDIAMEAVRLWCNNGLKNVRFSGGEPTLYAGLNLLVKYCKEHGVERIAISTNGSSRTEYYKYLVKCGVNDFSISLDGGCCSVGDKMAGGIAGAWEKVVENIKELSKLTYVTVGVVFTDENVFDAHNTIRFAASLGVSDIRVIPAAQYNKAFGLLSALPDGFVDRFPILKYRTENAKKGKQVRGIKHGGNKCRLVLDDMAVAGGYHFPCIIYMREGGDPIGVVGEGMRKEREEWMLNHCPDIDKICSKMCLDVCIDFNRVASINKLDRANQHRDCQEFGIRS